MKMMSWIFGQLTIRVIISIGVAQSMSYFQIFSLQKKPISLRVTTGLLARVKMVANKKDMPYQTLMKQYIESGVAHDIAA